MATFQTQQFIEAQREKGVSDDKIAQFLQSKGIDPTTPSQEIARPGKVNILERLKLSFGGEEAKQRGRMIEEQAGLRGKLDIGDIADIAGQVPSLAGFAAGGAVGGIAGGAVGAAGGEAVRQLIGKQLGVEEFQPSKIAKEAIMAGGVGIAGKGIAKAGQFVAEKTITPILEKLPKRLISSALKQTPKEAKSFGGQKAVQTILEKGKVGTADSILKSSNKAVETLGSQINEKLVGSTAKINFGQVLKATKAREELSQAVLNKKSLFKTINGLVPQAERLTNKLSTKSITLREANQLRQIIDRTLGDRFFMASQNPYNKEVLNAFSRELSKLVQTKAPKGTESLFAELSKEISVRNAIGKRIERGAGKEIISFGDLIGGGIGGVTGGVPGAFLGAGIRRGLQSTPFLTGAGVTLQRLGGLQTPQIVKTGIGTAGRIGLFEALKSTAQQR